MDHTGRARELFRSGYSCSQSVVGAFCEEMGLPMEMAMRLASSFGGGMGGLRESCGAVTGMFMVAGMIFGYEKPMDYVSKKEHYARIRALAGAFQEQNGTIVCRELLKSLPEKLQTDPMPRTEEYYKVRPCIRFVESAAAILDKLIAEENRKKAE